MIEIRTLTPFDLAFAAAPWRDSLQVSKLGRPLAVDQIVGKFKLAAKAGAALPIHVAFVDDAYIILDGHLILEALEDREEIQVILHTDVVTLDAAKQRYVSMNYLRASEWMRSGVILSETLAGIKPGEMHNAVADESIADDLISRNNEQWETFNKEIMLRDKEREVDNEDQLDIFAPVS